MSETLTAEFACGDAEALITYLYGEGSDAERDKVAAHLARCIACAEEVAALGSTREQLAAWTPPDQSLGFRITATDVADRPAATVLAFEQGKPPARWWSQPLPAWAQMAAAVAIFATGMAMGAARNAVSPASPAAPAVAVTRTAVPVNTSVSREELAQLETRLRGEMAQMRTAAAPVDATGPVSTSRVNQLIAQSEQRQQKELALRVSEVMKDVNSYRAYDIGYIRKMVAGVSETNQRRVNSIEQQQIDMRRGLGQPAAFTPPVSPSIP